MSFPREWCPKMLREYLCSQQTFAPDRFTRDEIQRLIDVLDLHRPLASNGKHGNLHTPTCGCDDKPVGGSATPADQMSERAASAIADLMLNDAASRAPADQPEQDVQR